jgi:hypothetical protein
VGETTEMVWNGKKNGLKDNKFSSEHLKFNEKVNSNIYKSALNYPKEKNVIYILTTVKWTK